MAEFCHCGNPLPAGHTKHCSAKCYNATRRTKHPKTFRAPLSDDEIAAWNRQAARERAAEVRAEMGIEG